MSRFTMLALMLAVLLGSKNLAAGEIQWLGSIEEAKQVAGQSGRLVLVHFWSTTCPPCVLLEREVYSQPGIASQLGQYFVPVKINVEQYPGLSQRYQVRVVPTDLILAADGQVVAMQGCDRKNYLASLTRIAAAHRAKTANPYTGVASQYGRSTDSVPIPSAVQPASHLGPRYSEPPARQLSQPVSNNFSTLPTGIKLSNQAAPKSPAATKSGPQLALQGTCPVELVDSEKWILGDRRWGVVHRGRLYLFSGESQKKRFMNKPDYYSPVLAGNDPVLAIELQKSIRGHRQHGLFYKDRIFLFSSEQTLEKFSAAPDHYLASIRQAEATGRMLR
ncbi:MAG: DUF255 domain-containing protein [Planctomycetales bacterium]